MKKITLLLSAITFLSISTLKAQFPKPPENADKGFIKILTQNKLKNWEGDKSFWTFKNGVLIGQETEDHQLKENSFFIWKKEMVRNFDLKVECRINPDGNSGIQYRSVKVDGKNYVLTGYQDDIDGVNHWSGQNYEEKGRGFMALRGQITNARNEKTPVAIGTVGDNEKLKDIIKDGWNEYEVIARDNVLIHLINGRVTSIVIDDNASKRRMKGLLGVQLHAGHIMKVEYRNLLLKTYD